MNTPPRLFKYLPSEFVPSLVKRGKLLFRNLSFFRKIEEEGRGDLLEGLHMDYPDNDIMIDNLSQGTQWKGRAAFLNSVNTDRIFAFCLSETMSDALSREFSASACIEILEVEEFIRRCSDTVSRQPRFREFGLMHGQVDYYAPNRPARRSVKDTRSIPFFKHASYSHQKEYRLAVALRGALKLTERIVTQRFTFDQEVAAGKSAHRNITIGSIEDIVKIHEY